MFFCIADLQKWNCASLKLNSNSGIKTVAVTSDHLFIPFQL